MLLPLRGVATPGHGEGEGSAGDKFRVSGTQETVEGAGANEVSGVLSEASCCRCGAPLIKKKRPTLFSRPLYLLLMDSERHTQTEDLEHLEAYQKAVIIILKTVQLCTGNFFKQYSLFIDSHLFISIIFAKFTYPFRDAEGLILTKISRYETDKIQDF